MLGNRSVLGIIPARGGSKGLPRKNILPMLGKPTLAWTIEAARASRLLDRLILSSEDPEIMAVAREWGCDVPFVRPMALAADDTPGIAPVLHALQALPERYDYVVLLQPTSPLRTAGDIDGCIEACVASGAPACVSISPASTPPEHFRRMDAQGHLHPLLDDEGADRRQDYPRAYVLNGAVYVARSDFLLQAKTFFTPETIGYIMPAERSPDIDSGMDFIVCEALLQLREPDPVTP